MNAFGEIGPFNAYGIQVEAVQFIQALRREQNQGNTHHASLVRCREGQRKRRQHAERQAGRGILSFVTTDSMLLEGVAQIRSSEIPSSWLIFLSEWNFQRGIGIFCFGT
jgi:hypothetical protein